MNEEINKSKLTILFQGHSVTVDLRKIVAINHPNDGDKFFRVYFGGDMVWNVGLDQHDRLYKAWQKL